MLTPELKPAQISVPANPVADDRLVGFVEPAVVTSKRHVNGKDWIKAFVAFFQLAMAITLFGMISFQVHFWPDSSVPGGVHFAWTARAVLTFGLVFAVLQAISGAGMYLQLIGAFQHNGGHDTVLSVLQVTTAIGFLVMGFACKNIEIGVPEGIEQGQARVLHAIEAFAILNWFFVMTCAFFSSTKQLDWATPVTHHRKAHRKTAFAVATFASSLVLLGTFGALFQLETDGVPEDRIGLSPSIGTLFITFGILFAVLQAMTGITMMQQCSKYYQCPSGESVTGMLTISLAIGIVSFGVACRHIYLGVPATANRDHVALVIAAESFVVINFAISLLAAACTGLGTIAWKSEAPAASVRGLSVLGIFQVGLAVILFGLIGATGQVYTQQEPAEMQKPDDAGFVYAGENLLGFGLIFAVLEGIAGLTMMGQATNKLQGQSLSSTNVVNKVTFAAACLAMGFACRHIYLFREGPHPSGYFVALLHSIEAFVIINWGFTFAVEISTLVREI